MKAEFQAIRGEGALPLALQDPPRPLRWLSEAWKKAGRPSGRPLQSARHFQLYRVMEFLRDLGLRLTDIQGLFGHEAMSKVQEEPREVLELIHTCTRRYRFFREKGLTEQAIRKEMHREWQERRAQWTDYSDGGEKLYERLEQAYSHTVDALLSRDMAGETEQAIVNDIHTNWKLAEQRPQNTIKEQMQNLALLIRKWFGSIRPEELWRRCRWVEHQFYVPHARLSGERVKDMKMSKVRGWVSLQRLRGAAPQPSDRDYFHFKMISVLVRQEGLSKAEAIAGLAKQYGKNGSVKMIRQSLARVSRYEEAVAPVVGREPVDPRDFWQPGILKERLEKLFKTKA